METVIFNGKVYTPEGVIHPGVVVMADGKFKVIGRQQSTFIPPQAKIVDAAGKAVVPGFIDVHLHGLMGHDVMGPSLVDVIKGLPAYGVTSFMATTLTLPRKEILSALHAMDEVLMDLPQGAQCMGIHLEGPYLSPSRSGMATKEWTYPLTWEDFQTLQKASGSRIRMITFAPEIGEAMKVIPELIAAGVVPVIGHSDATFDQVAEAVKLGLNHATHTYNAMRPLGHREPGVVGAVMYFNAIYAELIADSIHVHPAAMFILFKVKGLDKLVLVSDAAPFAGLPAGEYEWEHKPVYVKDNRCCLADGTLAGAHALLDTGVRNLVEKLGLSLEEALIPVTRTPAASLNMKNKGRIAPGCDADLVLLDDKLLPCMTFVKGELVWQRVGHQLNEHGMGL
jgi:N-acetylglucosamine-6-phosphate deacetylase